MNLLKLIYGLKVVIWTSPLKRISIFPLSLSAIFKPVGVVLLPRRSGIPSSSPSMRQRIRHQHSYRPRIPPAQCPWRLSHKLLQFVVRGVNFSCLHLHFSCRPHHQSLPELSTRLRWKWNTIACSSHGSYRCGDHRSRILATLFCPTVCQRDIPEGII